MANFTIVESANAEYFTLTDVRAIAAYTIKVQSDAMSDITEKTLALDAGQIADLDTGLVLEPTDFGYSETSYVDGIYTFKVTKDAEAEELYTVGFSNIITGKALRNALEYRVNLDIKTKDWIEEQNRLLNNLEYAARVGSDAHYLENLANLELLQ
jgi:hypothetical protein